MLLLLRRVEVEYLYEQRLDQLGVDLEEQLDVGLVEPVQVLHAANEVQVGAARVAPGADSLEVAAEKVVVGILKRKK